MHNQYLIEDRYDKKYTDLLLHFRNYGEEIAIDPNKLSSNYFHKDLLKHMIIDRDSTCIDRVERYEALAYGDIDALMASPGPNLAGIIMRMLGSDEQKNIFFDYIEHHKALSFFAMTEPTKGSDASNMYTHVNNNKIYGEKCFVGNGANAPIGVVFARPKKDSSTINVFLLTEEIINTIHNKNIISTSALKGARLSYINFEGVEISENNLLGAHLKPLERGLIAMVRTFNAMRPCVAALAIGQAQAILDYCLRYKHSTLITYLNDKLNVIRNFNKYIAKGYEQNNLNTANTSLAKVQATKMVRVIADQCFNTYFHLFIEHPWLSRAYLNSFAYEYMEGTQDIHYFNLLQGYVSKTLIHTSV